MEVDRRIAVALLEEGQTVGDGEILTLRVYSTAAAKRAAVVKDDEILTMQEM